MQTSSKTPSELLEFSLAIQDSLRVHLGDSIVEAARAILETQRGMLEQRAPKSGRLDHATELGLVRMLAEVVLADGVVCAVEDEAANTYILDHLAVDDADAARLMELYEEAKSHEGEHGANLRVLEKEDREAIFDACCKVAWADKSLDQKEDQVLQNIADRLNLDAEFARSRSQAYGSALQEDRTVHQVYTHVEMVEVLDAVAAIVVEPDAEWLTRTLQLLAINHLTQKKSPKVSSADRAWCAVLGETDPTVIERALSNCGQLQETSTGFLWKPGVDDAAKRQAQAVRVEATLLRLLLGHGSPLTSRFLSFRINPPKPYPEMDLIRLADSSPSLVRYGIGSGKWLGARAWGHHGAAQLVKEDWSLIKRDLKKNGEKAAFTKLEWQAIGEHARVIGEVEVIAFIGDVGPS